MDYKDQSEEVKKIIMELASESGYGNPEYTNLNKIDPRFWENCSHEESVIILAKKVAELKKDKLLLDKLQLTSQNYGDGWKLRISTSGRGMRLHETSASKAFKNVRDAIDNYDLEKGI